MATKQKRKAEEQLIPNLLVVTQPVILLEPRQAQQTHRTSSIMDARSATRCAWNWLTSTALAITTFYGTRHHNENDSVTETHVRSTTCRDDGAVSIKRRKTKNPKTTAKQNESEFIMVPKDPYRKGGTGEPDFSGCVTEEQKAKRLELFWEPPELVPRRRCDLKHPDQRSPGPDHISKEDEGRHEDDNGLDESLQDTNMVDYNGEEYGEEELVNCFDGGIDSAQGRPSSTRIQKSNKVNLQYQQSDHTPEALFVDSRLSSSPVKSLTELMGGRERSNYGTWSAHNLSTKSEMSMDAVERRQISIEEQVNALLIDVPQTEAGEKQRVKNDSGVEVKKDIKEQSKHGLEHDSRKVIIQHPDERSVYSKNAEYNKSKPLKGILKKESKYDLENELRQGILHLTPSKDKLAQRVELLRKRENEEKAARAKAKKEARLYRRHPSKSLIQALDSKWDSTVRAACSNPNTITTTLPGQPLTSKDFGTLLRTRDWLNDEIINGYVEWVVDAANKAVYAEAVAGGEKPGKTPKFIAHNSFFYNILDDPKKGAKTTARLMKRKGAPGISLMDVDTVFVPICKSMHWTLGVVRPFAKTIEYFDSMGGRPSRFFHLMREWLAFQLGEAYVTSEWTESYTKCAHQSNGYDCGVFLCTNAFCVAAGLDPLCYDECNLAQQRKNIAAILINRGFVGDFQWTDDL